MIKIDQLIQEFSHHLAQGAGALFVGAGISVPSKAPDWFNLLKPHLAKLGIDLDKFDDLPLMAQHVVNSAAGNRGPLMHAVRQAFARLDPPNQYHAAIARMNVPLIWTTNFDMLLESALAPQAVLVRTSDATITQRVERQAIEIIKMHGCIKTSSDKDIVLTQEDYENFFVRRPALADRLTMDLLQKSFLFLGYRLGDPNIGNILVQARRLSRTATPPHYMFLKKESSTDRQRRSDLWAVDLGRVGIQCCFVDNYDEVEQALFEIARKSRGRSLFVTGSHTDPVHSLAIDIGRHLARDIASLVLLDGQSTGVSRVVINSFTEECLKLNRDIHSFLKLFPNPYAANAAYSNNKKLLPALKSWRMGLLRSAQAVLVFDGRMGTEAEIEVARSIGCQIVPVPGRADGLAMRLFKEKDIGGQLPKHYRSAVRKRKLTAQDVIDCIRDVTS